MPRETIVFCAILTAPSPRLIFPTSPLGIPGLGNQQCRPGRRILSGYRGYRGFLRDPNGNIAVFNVPGPKLTYPSGINDAGQVVGTFSDGGRFYHGFLRDPSGNITTFDLPVARAGSTEAYGINNAGEIVGYFLDGNRPGSDGFLRDATGNITIIDEPAGRLPSREISTMMAKSWDAFSINAAHPTVFFRVLTAPLSRLRFPAPRLPKPTESTTPGR